MHGLFFCADLFCNFQNNGTRERVPYREGGFFALRRHILNRIYEEQVNPFTMICKCRIKSIMPMQIKLKIRGRERIFAFRHRRA